MSPETNPRRILLTDTTRWSCAPRLGMALAKAGAEVFALCPIPGHPMAKTHAVRQVFPYRPLQPLPALRAAIAACDPQIVIPFDDLGVQHLHELHREAEREGFSGREIVELVERSLGAAASFAVVSSRADLLQLAESLGLRVPQTAVVHDLAELQVWGVGHELPWVLKADGTWGGRGVRMANSWNEADRQLRELTRPLGAVGAVKRLALNRDQFWLRSWWKRVKPPVIVQEHIEGRPANCAVVCWQGKVLAGIGVEVLNAQMEKGPAAVVRVVENREMMMAAERLAGELGLSGFFGLDFMIENGSGKLYLIEMNPRCTPLCHLQLGEGRDMVAALWAELSGVPQPPATAVTENDFIAYFPQAWSFKSRFLDASFQDVPSGEPELLQQMLHPWPERRWLARVFDRLRKRQLRASQDEGCVFEEALASSRLAGCSTGGRLVPSN